MFEIKNNVRNVKIAFEGVKNMKMCVNSKGNDDILYSCGNEEHNYKVKELMNGMIFKAK